MNIKKDSLVYQYILALTMVLQKSALFVDGISADDCSPEERAIIDAISLPIFAQVKPDVFLKNMENMLTLWAPGQDIAAINLGFVIKNEPNDKALGILLKLMDDKSVIYFMDRTLGELVEKALKEHLDKAFGRLIKL
jgi:hypothetical protein